MSLNNTIIEDSKIFYNPKDFGEEITFSSPSLGSYTVYGLFNKIGYRYDAENNSDVEDDVISLNVPKSVLIENISKVPEQKTNDNDDFSVIVKGESYKISFRAVDDAANDVLYHLESYTNESS